MKVLLCGIQYFPNQMSRAFESYGLEVIHVNGDPNSKLPTAIDAVCIATGQSSHEIMWQAKAHAKNLNIPCFISYTGFSQIKEQVEAWLIKENGLAIRKASSDAPSGAIAEAFKAASTPKPKEQEGPIMPLAAGDFKNKYSAVMKDALASNLSADETMHLLINSGLKNNSKGDPWRRATVYQALEYARKKQAGLPTRATPQAYQQRKSSALPSSAKPTTQLELIQKVMASKLGSERKLELVDEISAGLMVTDNTVMAVREEGKLKVVARNILKDSDEALILIDLITAAAIMQLIPEIKAYLESGGEV